MFCTKCGRKLHDEDRFCAYCGTPTRADVQAENEEEFFTPPFKAEAERKTAEISKEIEENTRKPQVVKTESPVFNWNLEGFPQNEPKKTEEVNFHWESIASRKRPQEEKPLSYTAPIIDKIELTNPQPQEVTAEKKESWTESQSTDSEELEREIFGKNYRPLNTMNQDEAVENTAQLEKFYTYNKKKEAFQELLDKEYDRLHTMEAEQRLDAESLEYTWARNLLIDKDKESPDPAKSTAADAEPANREADALKAGKGIVPTATIDFSAIREESRQQKRQEAAEADEDERKEIPTGAEESSGDETEEAFVEAAENLADQSAEAAAEASGEAVVLDEATADEAAVLDETTAGEGTVLDGTVADEVVAEKATGTEEAPEEIETPPSPSSRENVFEGRAEERAAEGAEESAAGSMEERAAEGTEESAAGSMEERAAEGAEESAPGGAEERTPEGADESAPKDAAEKTKLRYSDIFPREAVAGGDDGGDSAGRDAADSEKGQSKNQGKGQVDEKGEKGKKEERDKGTEEDQDGEEGTGRAGLNFFLKAVITLLVLLILLEMVILVVKYVAPESAFSQKTNAVVESIVDRLTGGGDSDADLEEGEGDAEEQQTSFITEILNSRKEAVTTIGQVSEDTQLKYDLTGANAFDEISQTVAFNEENNGDWRVDESGNVITYGEGILDAVVSYYDQWQATNQDADLVGINKLEIGEIRTGADGYYVLCRLTYAGSSGVDVMKKETAYVKISQDSMVIDEIREETE